MRRLLLLALTSVLCLSACSTAAATQAQPPANDAPNGGHGLATPVASPTASVGPSGTPWDADWVAFAPDGGGYVAKFPATPKLTTSTAKTTFGDSSTSLWTDEHAGNLSFFIQETVYPAGPLIALQSAAIYDAAITSLSGGANGLTLSGETDQTVTGHSGKLFLLTSSLGSVKGVVVLVGSTVYLAFVAYTSSVDGGMIDAFLVDFTLSV